MEVEWLCAFRASHRFYLCNYASPRSRNVFSDLRVALGKLVLSHNQVFVAPIIHNKFSRQFWLAVPQCNGGVPATKSLLYSYDATVLNEIAMVTTKMTHQLMEFTIGVKLRPKWTVMGEWLVTSHARGDLYYNRSDASRFKAIKIKSLQESDHATSLKVELSLVSINSSSCQFPYSRSPFNDSLVSTMGLVYVLPSLKQATLVARFSHLPRNDFFKSRCDVINYWRDMYGYKLSPSKHDYAEVRFVGNTKLIYPAECVLDSLPSVTTLSSESDQEQTLQLSHMSTPKSNVPLNEYSTLRVKIAEELIGDLNCCFTPSFRIKEISLSSSEVIGCQLTPEKSTSPIVAGLELEATPPLSLNSKRPIKPPLPLLGMEQLETTSSFGNKFAPKSNFKLKQWDELTSSQRSYAYRNVVSSRAIQSNVVDEASSVLCMAPENNKFLCNRENVDMVVEKLWNRAQQASRRRKQNLFEKYKSSP